MSSYASIFWDLVHTPFQHIELIWGIVPLYFALLVSELTSATANFRTAIQTGFSFIWAATQWLYFYFQGHPHLGIQLEPRAVVPINLFVTFLVLALGVVAFYQPVQDLFGIENNLTTFCFYGVVALSFFILPTYVGLTLAGSSKPKAVEKKEQAGKAGA